MSDFECGVATFSCINHSSLEVASLTLEVIFVILKIIHELRNSKRETSYKISQYF